jgi:hypothetical protein
MGKNTGKSFRVGATKDRSQIKNPKTGQFIKRDSKTGRFMSSKNTPYKGVSKEKSKNNKNS